MGDDIYVRVEGIFRVMLGEEHFRTFHATATMDDVDGWTSLTFLEMIMALENEFNIRIDGLDAANLTSVPNILEYLKTQP